MIDHYKLHLVIEEGVEEIKQEMIPQEVTSVVLPKSCRVVADNAFNSCSRLSSLEVQSPLDSIGESAFKDCSSLTEMDFSRGLCEVYHHAFHGCKKLVSIRLPYTMHEESDSLDLTYIDWGVFHGCDRLEWFAFSPNLREVGKTIFQGCSSLDLFIVPDSLECLDEDVCEVWLRELREHRFKCLSSDLQEVFLPVRVITQSEFCHWKESCGLASRKYTMSELVFLFRVVHFDHVVPSLDYLIAQYPDVLVSDLMRLLPEQKRTIFPEALWIQHGDNSYRDHMAHKGKFFVSTSIPHFLNLLDLETSATLSSLIGQCLEEEKNLTSTKKDEPGPSVLKK